MCEGVKGWVERRIVGWYEANMDEMAGGSTRAPPLLTEGRKAEVW